MRLVKIKQNIVIYSFFIIASIFLVVKAYSQDIIEIKTELVIVPVTVLDYQGRYISDLKKENFKLFEDGVEQEIDYFKTVEQPITIFLLLDTSGSMKPYLNELLIAANAFVSELRPDDTLTVIEYADWRKTLIDSVKVKDMPKGIKLKKWGRERETITFDVVDHALKKIKKVNGRKAIVLFSDGELFGKMATAESNLEDAEEQEAIIYTMHFKRFGPSRYVSEKQYQKVVDKIMKYVKGLPNLTGGRYFHIDDIANLKNTFAQIANELGQQYQLGYYPENPGKKGERREIKVKVNIPNVAVRARKSYIVGSNK